VANSGSAVGIWVGQPLHFTCLAALLLLVYLMWRSLGAPLSSLFWCAIVIPVVHQLVVWLVWRLELQYETISRTIGLRGYLATFFVLFAGRFISLLVLAWADRGSLGLGFAAATILAITFALPGSYAMYSVKRYFGMTRAAGADHFETRYRNMPLVKEGIFRFTRNGMYLYAFLLFWAIAIGFNSSAALVVAVFSHIYIWVHFYTVEKPDMEFIYSSSEN